jgi:hypothetical protein
MFFDYSSGGMQCAVCVTDALLDGIKHAIDITEYKHTIILNQM